MSSRCRKILPAGALRIRWPADQEYEEEETLSWCILKPCNFNKDVHLGWRLDASEIIRREASAQDKASKRRKR